MSTNFIDAYHLQSYGRLILSIKTDLSNCGRPSGRTRKLQKFLDLPYCIDRMRICIDGIIIYIHSNIGKRQGNT